MVLAVSDGWAARSRATWRAAWPSRPCARCWSRTTPTRQAEGQEPPLIEAVRNATTYANYAIHRRSLEDARCSGMGATLTAAAITGGRLELVQVGDSRAYVIRGGEIRLATKDQSLVQQLVDVGQITEEDAETHMFRNVILQALGAQSDLAPVVSSVPLRRGDLVLLCSDGLSGKMRAEEMREIIDGAQGNLPDACDALIREANVRGGEDNITSSSRARRRRLSVAARRDQSRKPPRHDSIPHETSEDTVADTQRRSRSSKHKQTETRLVATSMIASAFCRRSRSSKSLLPISSAAFLIDKKCGRLRMRVPSTATPEPLRHRNSGRTPQFPQNLQYCRRAALPSARRAPRRATPPRVGRSRYTSNRERDNVRSRTATPRSPAAMTVGLVTLLTPDPT